MVAVAAFAFIGCDKDDSSSSNGGDLAGTTWVCSESGYQETLTFRSGGRVTSSWSSNYGSGNGDGSYTYDPPVINIHLVDDGDSFFYSGTVNGNVMNLTSYGETYVFTKR